MPFRCLGVIALLVISTRAIDGTALAQSELPGAAAQEPAASKDTSDEGALLAGPKVDEEPGAADNPAFGGEDRMRQTTEIPPTRWFAVVKEMSLSEKQSAEANAIAGEYQMAVRAFRAENAETLRALEQRIRETRASNTFDPKLREEYRAVQASAPKVEEYQSRIWALLDEAQQAELRERLEKVRAEIAERRAQERSESLDTMRAGPRTGAPMMGDDDESGGGMSGGGQPMSSARGGERGGRSAGAGLDAMSVKRFEFLMSKRSKHAPARPVLDRMREGRGGGAGRGIGAAPGEGERSEGNRGEGTPRGRGGNRKPAPADKPAAEPTEKPAGNDEPM